MNLINAEFTAAYLFLLLLINYFFIESVLLYFSLFIAECVINCAFILFDYVTFNV